MGTNLLAGKLKQAYLELEGRNFNLRHLQENRARYLKMLEFILPAPLSAKILDIGCGFCYLTKFLKLQRVDVVGVDFFYGDIPAVRCAESGIPFSRLNIEIDDFPFGKDVFDVILFGEVLEHLTYSPITPLKKIRKALKKGGKLIITTPNALSLANVFKILTGHNLYPDLESFCQAPILYRGKSFFYRHNRLYTLKELRELTSQSGFRIISSGFIRQGIYRKDLFEKVVLKSMAFPLLFTFPQFREFLWVVAEKR